MEQSDEVQRKKYLEAAFHYTKISGTWADEVLVAEVLSLRADLNEQIEASAAEHKINTKLAKRITKLKARIEELELVIECTDWGGL